MAGSKKNTGKRQAILSYILRHENAQTCAQISGDLDLHWHDTHYFLQKLEEEGVIGKTHLLHVNRREYVYYIAPTDYAQSVIADIDTKKGGATTQE